MNIFVCNRISSSPPPVQLSQSILTSLFLSLFSVCSRKYYIKSLSTLADGEGSVSTKMPAQEILRRRHIRPIESNAKCRYLKKLTCKGTLRPVFYLSQAPSPPMTPYSPLPLHTVRIRVYNILIHTGKGGGGRWAEKNENWILFSMSLYISR